MCPLADSSNVSLTFTGAVLTAFALWAPDTRLDLADVCAPERDPRTGSGQSISTVERLLVVLEAQPWREQALADEPDLVLDLRRGGHS